MQHINGDGVSFSITKLRTDNRTFADKAGDEVDVCHAPAYRPLHKSPLMWGFFGANKIA
jgi:hypothetical protein